ncbi:hypothetical protein ABH899_002954, partial [Paenibacillus sp. RC84]
KFVADENFFSLMSQLLETLQSLVVQFSKDNLGFISLVVIRFVLAAT